MASAHRILEIAALAAAPALNGLAGPGTIMTTGGEVRMEALGETLPHEHILVDFIGSAGYDAARWNADAVVRKVLPYLQEAQAQGWQAFVDCTPNYLGRDAALLKRLSELSGLRIVTNTGYYGGSDHKFLPAQALTQTDRELADFWTGEFRNGIGSSGVRPGFIKISVNPGPLSEISKKLARAAALTHLQTGLTIMSHTGPGLPALEQIEILKQNGVSPEAFIWTHAQNEKDRELFVRAAREGAWISLDGIDETNADSYADTLAFLRENRCLDRVLLSHDAGWFDPAKPGGGEFRGFTTLRARLIPELQKRKFADSDIQMLIRTNPARAFEIRIRAAPPNR